VVNFYNLLISHYYNFVNSHSEVKKIISNTSWLFADRLFRMLFSLIVGVWMARYLGPENFGILNYVISFTSLFFSIATLGLDSVIVHKLIKDPESEKTTLGTIFTFQFLGGLIAYTILYFSVHLINANQQLVISMTLIYGFVLLLKSFEVFKYWFESKLQSKLSVWAENVVYFAFIIVKIIFLISGVSLITLTYIVLIEAILTAFSLFLIYVNKYGSIKLWNFSINHGIFFLKDSWPFIISGIAVVVYTRIDSVMLGQMLGNKSVGIYSVALRISEIWYFIPMTIVASAFPSIIASKLTSEEVYINNFKKLFRVLFLIAFFIAVCTTLFAKITIALLYGDKYIESASLLIIQTWSGIFVFLGVAGGRWFLAENLQGLLIYRTILGAITNIGLNIVLIPKYGIHGAAFATLISQAVANLFSNFFGKKSRQLFRMQIESIFWFLKPQLVQK
jgi:O-antigen/teichoic acid export membrane protein